MCFSKCIRNPTCSVKLSGPNVVENRFIAMHRILIRQGGNRIQRLEAGAL